MNQYILAFILVAITGFVAMSVFHRVYISNLIRKILSRFYGAIKKRRIIILSGIIIALLATAAVTTIRRNITLAQHQRAYVMMNQLLYANEMWLDLRIVVDNEEILGSFHTIRSHIDPSSLDFDPSFTEMAFVHNHEAAAALPNNIIASWPRADCYWVYGLAAGINWAVNRDEADLVHFLYGQLRDVICFTDFGLNYPLTIADMIDYWEEVSALWQAIPQHERSDIRRFASSYASSCSD